MTFDARGGSSGSGSNNLVFGIAAVAVVGVAFAGTFMLGGKSSSVPAQAATQTAPIEMAAVKPVSLAPSLTSQEAKAYMIALAAVDADAHEKLARKLQRSAGKSESARFDIIGKHAAKTIKANSAYLEKADARHLDRVLSHTRTSLKKASRANSKWCRGSTYVGLENASAAEIKALQNDILNDEKALQTYSFEVMTLLMEAAADGRDNPVNHTKLTSTDEMAIQGVVMSMMSDPQIMPLLLASQSGQSSEQVLSKLNVCDLGATFVSAVKTLPQDTKGRLWAEIIREAELGGADVGRLGRLAGY